LNYVPKFEAIARIRILEQAEKLDMPFVCQIADCIRMKVGKAQVKR
jgi:hypothetical protein